MQFTIVNLLHVRMDRPALVFDYVNFLQGTPAGESSKVESFLRSPFDFAAFGPRLAVGALLSLPEAAQNL